MKILGFIPARKKSKRLKNKNMRLFLGKPLISHTINFSKKINLDGILVSTDSKKIYNLSKRLGNKVNYIRPSNLSGDKSQIIEAILHGVNFLNKKEKKIYDTILLLQPTTPYRSIVETKKIINFFRKKKLQSLATVSKTNEHPQHMYRFLKSTKWDHVLKKRINSLNKQDLCDDYFYENGHIYLCSVKFLKRYKKFIVKNKTFLYKQNISTLDIDYLQDFKICEFRVKEKLFD